MPQYLSRTGLGKVTNITISCGAYMSSYNQQYYRWLLGTLLIAKMKGLQNLTLECI